MKHKKLIAAFLAAAMAVTCLPQAAIAEPLAQETPTEGVPQEAGTLSAGDRFTEGDFEYEVIDSYSVAVVDYYGSDTKITIPSEVLFDGWYRYDVTEIGSYAFYEQRSLTEVTLPDTITAIENSAFAYCRSLKTINIPYSVTQIGPSAFRSCGLEKITVPFLVDTIGTSAFDSCSSLTEVHIDGLLDELGYGAFADCVSLKTVTLEYVKEIDSRAFSHCSSLEEIELPVNLETIGEYAFEYCSSLTEITLPWNVAAVEAHAFRGCKKLTAIHAEHNNNFYDIDGVLFTKNADNEAIILQYPEGRTDTSYSVPDGVKAINEYAFEYCSSLTKVNLPDSLTTIGECAFEGCSSLAEINLPDSVTEIKRQALRGCEALERVTLSKSLTTIEYAAFANCISLPEIDIPENVQTIEGCAFDGCKILTKAVIRSSIADISLNAFTKGTILYGPSADLTIYGYTNSSAETYAKEKEMDFVPLGLFLDSNNGVSVTADSGILPDDTKLNVEQTDTTDTSASYSITLTQNGQEIQPKGNVTVRIRIPFKYSGEPIYVYYEDDNGRLTDMHAVVSGNYIVFTTDHFSKYIATKDKLATVIPGDIDGNGVVNDIDVVSLARYLAGWGTEIEASAADVNDDKEINDLDTVALARQLAGWEL